MPNLNFLKSTLLACIASLLISSSIFAELKAGKKAAPDDPIWFDLERVVNLKSYRRHLKAYTPKSKFIDQVQSIKQTLPEGKGLTTVAYYGSWCIDSAREVPRLYNLVKAVGGSIQIVPLDKKKNPLSGAPKPVSRFSVPRIHFYYNGELIGVREVSMGGRPEKGLLSMLKKYQKKLSKESSKNSKNNKVYAPAGS